jgi:predicted Rossmann fold flavoprotein
MNIRFKQNGKVFLKKTGKLLFTHFGLSGPLIINSSFEVKNKLKSGKVIAIVDIFPDTDHKKLDKRLLKIFANGKNKQIKNALSEIIEDALAKEILKILNISLETKVNEITKEMRKALVHTMKELAISIVDTMGMDRAIVADGGVDLDEIDFKTMSSKLHKNVKIIGDLLNINRPSGGYSLQLC